MIRGNAEDLLGSASAFPPDLSYLGAANTDDVENLQGAVVVQRPGADEVSVLPQGTRGRDAGEGVFPPQVNISSPYGNEF